MDYSKSFCSPLDNRYSIAIFLRCRRGIPYEARIIPLDFEKLARPHLLVSCLNSVELLLSWGAKENRILWLLGNAMNAPWLLTKRQFDKVPGWLKLSALPTTVLVKFKLELINEIERKLILDIDPDPDEY